MMASLLWFTAIDEMRLLVKMQGAILEFSSHAGAHDLYFFGGPAEESGKEGNGVRADSLVDLCLVEFAEFFEFAFLWPRADGDLDTKEE